MRSLPATTSAHLPTSRVMRHASRLRFHPPTLRALISGIDQAHVIVCMICMYTAQHDPAPSPPCRDEKHASMSSDVARVYPRRNIRTSSALPARWPCSGLYITVASGNIRSAAAGVGRWTLGAGRPRRSPGPMRAGRKGPCRRAIQECGGRWHRLSCPGGAGVEAEAEEEEKGRRRGCLAQSPPPARAPARIARRLESGGIRRGVAPSKLQASSSGSRAGRPPARSSCTYRGGAPSEM
ncbi:hypothetical protein BC628DRAFT_994638 [Trametes gibbosa]|nr:hypothetical protein BC628DRAFT_994638 [Trametes gibbosa]